MTTRSSPAPLRHDGRPFAAPTASVPRRYEETVSRLDSLIRPAPDDHDATPAAIRARAELRLDRLRRFLAYLGDPQDTYRIVHVTGTSGKGSTAVAIASILRASGYRVGLHTSPYLQVATEKLQIDGRLIDADAFADQVEDVSDAAAAWSGHRAFGGGLSYGEVWTALALSWFARERVEVAVIEVGAGGRFDLTNLVRPSVSVITSVGLDHTETLGGTIQEIAWHKAGIVKPGAPVVTAVTDHTALTPIEAEVAARGTTLTRVIPGQTFEVLDTTLVGTRWRELGAGGTSGPILETALPGRFQATNAAVAVAAVRTLATCGLAIGEPAVREGLEASRLPGRFEKMPWPGRPRVVLDGAHNAQKVGAIAADIAQMLYPLGDNAPVVLFGALDGKDVQEMVSLLAPHAATLVGTEPHVLGKASAPVEDILGAAAACSFQGDVLVDPDPGAALEIALDRANRTGSAVLVTGSLYLVGNVRSRWYSDAAVVRERTPWPPLAG